VSARADPAGRARAGRVGTTTPTAPPTPRNVRMATTSFSYSGTELDALVAAPNYYRFIARTFAPYVGPRAVEVGAGIGTFAEHLLREAAPRELVLVEPADNNFPILREQLRDRPNVRVLHGYLEQVGAEVRDMDSIVAVNVLEHTPDDVAFLRAARATLRPGGSALIFVPAMQRLYGSLDAEFEHHRRYSKATLGRALADAGFRDVRLRHVNSLGILAWFAAGRVFRWRTIKASRVALYDRLVVPWLMALESRIEPPIGQSILAIATA